MKIGRVVSELWRVEHRPLPLTWPMAYTTACTTVQAVINYMYQVVQKYPKKPEAILALFYSNNIVMTGGNAWLSADGNMVGYRRACCVVWCAASQMSAVHQLSQQWQQQQQRSSHWVTASRHWPLTTIDNRSLTHRLTIDRAAAVVAQARQTITSQQLCLSAAPRTTSRRSEYTRRRRLQRRTQCR